MSVAGGQNRPGSSRPPDGYFILRNTPWRAQWSVEGSIPTFCHQTLARQFALNSRKLRGTYFGLSVWVAGRVFGLHFDTRQKRTFKNPDV
jgi:hypothetical protein